MSQPGDAMWYAKQVLRLLEVRTRILRREVALLEQDIAAMEAELEEALES